MFGLGMPELLVILVIVLLFFGKDKLPDLARSLGGAVRELRKGFSDGEAHGAKSENADTTTGSKK